MKRDAFPAGPFTRIPTFFTGFFLTLGLGYSIYTIIATGSEPHFFLGILFSSALFLLLAWSYLLRVQQWMRQDAKTQRILQQKTHDLEKERDALRKEIRERNKAERKADQLSRALEQTADTVMITDCEGTIEYVNAAFTEVTGYSRKEVLGRKPSLLNSGRHDESFFQEMWETILQGRVYRNVIINRRKNGEQYYEEKTITPLKDFQGNIINFIATGKDITERMHNEEHLHHLAHHDILTDLANRALFMDRLGQAIRLAHRKKTILAVLFLDLDRFKNINDTLGHNVGDELLKVIARRLVRTVRQSDTVARLGGDEFCLLLNDIQDPEDIRSIADKILYTISRPVVVQNHELYTTGSIGIALYPTDGRDGQTLLKSADTAMYRAKEMGKDTFQFFTLEMEAKGLERFALEASLRRALENNELTVYLQPQFDLKNHKVFGAEVLLRWHHPERGLVPCQEFVPILEESGLIHDVGAWVIEQACRFNKTWQDAGLPGIHLSVNLSARQFMNPSFVESVASRLRACDLDPQWLHLEITESMIMRCPQLAAGKMAELGRLGITFALDDFGTGYSSLNYLKRFPIGLIKIDRSFVMNLIEDPDDAALVKTIILMAHNLKLKVIAEGVETKAQEAFLRRNGCDAYQGFFFSRPLPPQEFASFLQSSPQAGRTA